MPTTVVTLKSALMQRLQQAGGQLLYAKGTDVDSASDSGFREAVECSATIRSRHHRAGRKRGIDDRRGCVACLPRPAGQPAEVPRSHCCHWKTCRPRFVQRTTFGAAVGRGSCICDGGGMVSGCTGWPGSGENPVWRRELQRKTSRFRAAQQLGRSRCTTTRRRPGALPVIPISVILRGARRRSMSRATSMSRTHPCFRLDMDCPTPILSTPLSK